MTPYEKMLDRSTLGKETHSLTHSFRGCSPSGEGCAEWRISVVVARTDLTSNCGGGGDLLRSSESILMVDEGKASAYL